MHYGTSACAPEIHLAFAGDSITNVLAADNVEMRRGDSERRPLRDESILDARTSGAIASLALACPRLGSAACVGNLDRGPLAITPFDFQQGSALARQPLHRRTMTQCASAPMRAETNQEQQSTFHEPQSSVRLFLVPQHLFDTASFCNQSTTGKCLRA
jgi:hypothetical protein